MNLPKAGWMWGVPIMAVVVFAYAALYVGAARARVSTLDERMERLDQLAGIAQRYNRQVEASPASMGMALPAMDAVMEQWMDRASAQLSESSPRRLSSGVQLREVELRLRDASVQNVVQLLNQVYESENPWVLTSADLSAPRSGTFVSGTLTLRGLESAAEGGT